MARPIKTQFTANDATHDLWKVAESGEIGRLTQLLALGADVNASNNSGVTPLMIAANFGRFEMVRALTDHGADVNATDKDGYTAAMLADSARRPDIVTLLLARGAKRIPKGYAAVASSRPYTQPRTFDASKQSNVASIEARPGVKKLTDPPNIWDVVHETHAEFDPRSAFIGHLTSTNPLVFALIALIAGGGALLGFITLRSWSASTSDAPAVETNYGNTQTATDSPAKTPGNTPSSLDQHPSSQATESRATESQSSQLSANTPNTTRSEAAANPKKSVVTSAESTKQVVPKRRQQDQTTSIPAADASPASLDKPGLLDRAQSSPTPAPKSSIEKRTDLSGERKEPDKAPSVEPAVPPKVRPTPNR